MFSAIFCILAFSFLFVQVQSGPKEHHHGPLMCNGKEFSIMTDHHNETLRMCHKKIFGSELPDLQTSQPPLPPPDHKKIMCVVICQLQEYGMIDQSGKPVEAEIEKFLKDTLPAKEAGEFFTTLKSCIKDNGNKVEISETDCSSSEKVIHCMRNGFVETCKIPIPADAKQ